MVAERNIGTERGEKEDNEDQGGAGDANAKFAGGRGTAGEGEREGEQKIE